MNWLTDRKFSPLGAGWIVGTVHLFATGHWGFGATALFLHVVFAGLD